jgi:nicotinate-nucleotide adenylyltransferase
VSGPASTGLFGGAFDPPHNGHVAVARGALAQLGLARLLVLVSERPGHREVVSDAAVRLRLAEAAFAGLPRTAVEVDRFARMVDLLRARPELTDPVVVVGADQLADFPSWKEPDEVLRLAHLAVATRPGIDEAGVAGALEVVARRERVTRFEIEPVAVSSSDLRARVARSESIERFVPPAVAKEVERLGLYRQPEARAIV